MDLAKRLLKIVRDNVGVYVFISMSQPTPLTGFIVPFNTESYVTNDPDLSLKFRSFLIQNFATGNGVVAYRRTGRAVFGNFNYFATQPEAENYALGNKLQYIYNLSNNSSVNLGSFDPSMPGDGLPDE